MRTECAPTRCDLNGDSHPRRPRPKSSDQPVERLWGASTTPAHFPAHFEERDGLRSEFIRRLGLQALRSRPRENQFTRPRNEGTGGASGASTAVPRSLIRYWHDTHRIPADVQACLETWEPLAEKGVVFRMFDDNSAASYIAAHYGRDQVSAFGRCKHPAMRSDYLRMCVLVAEGGLYVDADDELRDSELPPLFEDGNLKVQPLCYDIPRGGMVDATEPGLFDHRAPSRIFYVNNNPIAATANDPVLRRALDRATRLLLDPNRVPEIQSTTGPGNLSAALAAHANECIITNQPLRLDLLFGWETVATPDWTLGYRLDGRNWRIWNDWSFKHPDPSAGEG